MAVNIFDADIVVPDGIYIVAPGANCLGSYHRIPPDAFIIVVNKAIELPLNPTLWMCSEPYADETDWFQNNIDRNKAIACFWSQYLYEKYPDIAYFWEREKPLLTENDFIPKGGVLRRGATITGQAVQLAYWLRARRIVLCGFDAYGNKYFDDKPAGIDDAIDARAGEWDWAVKRMNPMIEWLIEHGIEVVSLSKTALNVPVTSGN